MRYCYQALLDIYEEIEKDMIKEERAFSVTYAKDEVIKTPNYFYTCISLVILISHMLYYLFDQDALLVL